jgi:hypothetical protein
VDSGKTQSQQGKTEDGRGRLNGLEYAKHRGGDQLMGILVNFSYTTIIDLYFGLGIILGIVIAWMLIEILVGLRKMKYERERMINRLCPKCKKMYDEYRLKRIFG